MLAGQGQGAVGSSTFALDALRELAAGLHLGGAVKILPGGDGLPELPVLGLVPLVQGLHVPGLRRDAARSACKSAFRAAIFLLGVHDALRLPGLPLEVGPHGPVGDALKQAGRACGGDVGTPAALASSS